MHALPCRCARSTMRRSFDPHRSTCQTRSRRTGGHGLTSASFSCSFFDRSRSSRRWGCCRCERSRRIRRLLGRRRRASRRLPGRGWILDLTASGRDAVFSQPSLNAFLAAGRRAEGALGRIAKLVESGHEVVPLDEATVHLPFRVGDYVDFYVARARHQPRTPLPPRRGSAPAELAPPSSRLSRPCGHRRRRRNTGRPAVRAGERA